MGRLQKYLIIGLAAALLFFIVKGEFDRRSRVAEIKNLHNQLAETFKTAELAKNLYMNKTQELDNVSSLLSSLRASSAADKKAIAALKATLDKKDEDILSATRLALHWKKAYEAEASSHQDDVPGEDGVVRKKVTFEKDFGYIGVDGYTLTDPSYAYVKVKQNRPLMLTLALTQDDSGVWKTYVTSSEEDIGVDVLVSAVNPHVISDRWYEKLQMTFGLALGAGSLVTSAGLSYDLGMFVVGPAVFAMSGDNSGLAYGGTLAWKPFKR